MTKFGEKVSFLWRVVDFLRAVYKPVQYGPVILPLIDRPRGYRSDLVTPALSGQIDIRWHGKEAA